MGSLLRGSPKAIILCVSAAIPVLLPTVSEARQDLPCFGKSIGQYYSRFSSSGEGVAMTLLFNFSLREGLFEGSSDLVPRVLFVQCASTLGNHHSRCSVILLLKILPPSLLR